MDYSGGQNITDVLRRTGPRRTRSEAKFHSAARRRVIRKSQSLPVTPETEGFRFNDDVQEEGDDDNHDDNRGVPNAVKRVTGSREPHSREPSSREPSSRETSSRETSSNATTPTDHTRTITSTNTYSVRFEPRKGVINLENITSKDMSFLMNPTPVLSKSKTEKFHKLFKTVPENEYPIDYFSCAFIGDILLQGNLYVSQNWFCFYSRIRGRGRLLEMPMEKVISITREKTAIIFPNAIGLQTAEEKYAFGSFISRDSTYRFLVSIWKKSQEIRAAESFASAQEDVALTSNENSGEESGDIDANGNATNHSNSKTDTSDQSDYSACVECGSADQSDNGETLTRSSANRRKKCKHRLQKQPGKEKMTSISRLKGAEWKGLKFPLSVIHCIDCNKTKNAFFKSAVKLQRIPRTNLLLAICTVLVLFLLLSAVGLTYKILDLEAKLETQAVLSHASQQGIRDNSYDRVYDLHTVVQGSIAQHMQTVLKANIEILEEIHLSLRDLQSSTKDTGKEPVCQSTDQCP